MNQGITSRLEKLGLHCAAVLYTGGSIAQLLKLRLDFSWQDTPYAIDWAIVILGSIGAITLSWLTPNIAYRGRWERPIHFVIIFHLALSVAVHTWAIIVRSHGVFAVFPTEYSYFAILYFTFFAWRSWTVRTKQA